MAKSYSNKQPKENLRFGFSGPKFTKDACFIITEEQEEEYEDLMSNTMNELNVLFEKKKSHTQGINQSVDKKFKKNYFNISFKDGIYIGVTHSNINILNKLTDSLMTHLLGIKTLFYTANSCLMDITGNDSLNIEQKAEVRENFGGTIINIDDMVGNFADNGNNQMQDFDQIAHKSIFKLDIN